MKVIVTYSSTAHQGTQKLARTLARNNHDVKLLTWDRGDIFDKIEKLDGYTAHRFQLNAHRQLKPPDGSLLVLLYMPIWWLYELYFFWKEKPDVIHACNLDTLPPAIVMKLFRVKLCYTIYDLYGGSFLDSIPSFVRNTVTWLERTLTRFVDVLFLVSETFFKDEEIKPKKLVYIYNSPEDCFAIVPKHEGFTIFYAGSIEKQRGLEDMINVVSNMPQVQLRIAGKIVDKSIIEYGNQFANFKYLGYISHNIVLRESLKADIMFVFYNPIYPNFRCSTPNKLFDSMMCGKPIIVNEGIAASDIVKRENCGIVVSYSDVDAIREAVTSLVNDSALREHLGDNGRRTYETKYSWKIMEDRLFCAYKELE